ncbi:WSC domain-containing protein 2 [Trichosurus vulpecula]|uniref:WSC domain-containing protein 2 n=1 Tax=Trichosurus vulpecula TaxID=9337 RepID=UPI00186B45CE|nr:WSC domain-containing protein 2 [Trichosurus vulpecula]
MAKLWVKFQRYFRRKPVRFFTLVALYLTAGSLVFLHTGFVGQPAVAENEPNPAASAPEGAELPYQDLPHLDRGFRETPESPNAVRRYGPWLKSPSSKDSPERGRLGDYGGTWSRALKGRVLREKEEERGKKAVTKAKYVGCYLDNPSRRALRGLSFFDYKKMTVFRCQDSCAERGYLYAGLEFGAECFCGHKIQGANASQAECNMECKGEKSNICGGVNRLSIYRLELAQESARRYGSAIFRGCFHRPDNLSLALPVTAMMLNMSVDKCVDFCTEKEYPLAALGGKACHCGFPNTRFRLHDQEDEQLCAQKCGGEEYESCGTANYFIVYQTQVQDNRCMDRRFLPGQSKELIALASFPGAGNTWARHLIELATGFYTGSYYFDGSLYNKGFRGERDHWRSGRTICIKTHESGQKEIEAFDAAILLIRNPYKALMAEFNRKYGGHIGFASQAHWKGKEWPEFVKNYAPWWATHTLDWLKYGKKVLVVHFEDLKQDLFTQLERMVSLLDVDVFEDRLLCVEGQKDGNFKRSGLRKLEYDPYTPEMQNTINSYIKMVDRALKVRNLTGVPDDYYPR